MLLELKQVQRNLTIVPLILFKVFFNLQRQRNKTSTRDLFTFKQEKKNL